METGEKEQYRKGRAWIKGKTTRGNEETAAAETLKNWNYIMSAAATARGKKRTHGRKRGTNQRPTILDKDNIQNENVKPNCGKIRMNSTERNGELLRKKAE